MSRRPRYSLMSLLILTALVAGGVKLWYGPHHVVERKGNQECEYRYKNDWRGNQILDGLLIRRDYLDDRLWHVTIEYFQEGEKLPWSYDGKIIPAKIDFEYPSYVGGVCVNPLSEMQQQEFDDAVRLEQQRAIPTEYRRLEYQSHFIQH